MSKEPITVIGKSRVTVTNLDSGEVLHDSGWHENLVTNTAAGSIVERTVKLAGWQKPKWWQLRKRWELWRLRRKTTWFALYADAEVDSKVIEDD